MTRAERRVDVESDFPAVGAEIFGLVSRVTGDEAVALRAAESLFVRFAVHRRAGADDARARVSWLLRAATNHALQALPDDARPGGEAPPPPAAGALPPMRELRKLDEAAQNVVVLARLDGLGDAEISEVLALPLSVVRRALVAAGAPAAAAGDHPSRLALARDRAVCAEHLAACARCRAIVDDADRAAAAFAATRAPPALARVAAAVRAERARLASRPRWSRVLWLAVSFAVVTALAFAVARPRSPERADVPYRGVKGASRATAAGIQIVVRRNEVVSVLDPAMMLRPGDRLHFRVRGETPRYLALHVRGPGGDVRVFPAEGTQAVLVRPGQALDRDYIVGEAAAAAPAALAPGSGADQVWIVGYFADHPFALDAPAGLDVEVVPVRADVERVPPPRN